MDMRKLFFLIVLAFQVMSVAAGQKTESIEGIWWNEGKTGKIKIEKKDGKFIGSIVYVSPDTYIDGKPPTDILNPDPKLRQRPVVGLQVLENLEYNASKKEWQNGKIYDPESGKKYDCFAKMDGETLKLKGYVAGMRFLGRETKWERADEET